MISTLDGIQINDNKEQPLNAYPSIRLSWEPDSNATMAKLLSSEKQPSQMISTLDGIQIDSKE
jgi:hypothetical protein